MVSLPGPPVMSLVPGTADKVSSPLPPTISLTSAMINLRKSRLRYSLKVQRVLTPAHDLVHAPVAASVVFWGLAYLVREFAVRRVARRARHPHFEHGKKSDCVSRFIAGPTKVKGTFRCVAKHVKRSPQPDS